MTFGVLAAVAIVWGAVMIRWSVARARSPWRARAAAASLVLLIAAAISAAIDVRDLAAAARAPRSPVVVTVTDMGPWWQLTYRRDRESFATANELHLPANERVTICWDGPAMNRWNAPGFPVQTNGCFSAAAWRDADAHFFRVWPPEVRRMHIVADGKFDGWFRNELRPAATRNASREFLFRDSGCEYCHTIRGVADKPFAYGPDLTHFGSRSTIAESGLPNRPGFLYGWIGDSTALQHGSEMPQNAVSAADLFQLTAYLESLK